MTGEIREGGNREGEIREGGNREGETGEGVKLEGGEKRRNRERKKNEKN